MELRCASYHSGCFSDFEKYLRKNGRTIEIITIVVVAVMVRFQNLLCIP